LQRWAFDEEAAVFTWFNDDFEVIGFQFCNSLGI
jgi:hypothetical protein